MSAYLTTTFVTAFIYADPTINAPQALQQRIAEIYALESSTVRWERTRKVKTKVRNNDNW